MGRYTNVQSYADNSPSMRTMSHERATGTTATFPSSSSPDSCEEGIRRPILPPPPTRDDHDQRIAGGVAASGGVAREDDVISKSSSTAPGGRGDGPRIDDDDEPRKNVIRRDPTAPSCDTCTLFVGGLHPRIGDLHLRKLFSPYGEIIRIHIVTHNPSEIKHDDNAVHSKAAISAKYATGPHRSKGFAFVEYARIESARLAMTRLDGRQLMGRSLAVRPSRKRTSELSRGGCSGGMMNAPGGAKVSAEDARREYIAVQSKIEAVKRAINQKKWG
ncbi:hypothetical protein ACHAXA_011091 [Cyclostephanos tholiformis]|uniref:RRM domain-containing protein n=1 Tax=Cyclostephanos tholiformis TaxID=382380 RepID=A0ABD3SFM5_9STRA